MKETSLEPLDGCRYKRLICAGPYRCLRWCERIFVEYFGLEIEELQKLEKSPQEEAQSD